MKTKTLRILSWNIAGHSLKRPLYPFRGGGEYERLQAVWNYIAASGTDVAFLQEAPAPIPLRESFQLHWLPAKGKPWGSAIASKMPFKTPFDLSSLDHTLSEPIKSFAGYNVAASYLIKSNQELLFASLHTGTSALPTKFRTPEIFRAAVDPHWGKTNVVYLFDAVMTSLLRLPSMGRRFVVGGDINFSRLMNKTMKGKNGITASIDEWFEKNSQRGLVDCFSQFHSEEQRTWYGKQQKSGRADHPYQLDHFFCDTETAKQIRNCWVDEKPALDGLSDHAPIWMEINIQ